MSANKQAYYPAGTKSGTGSGTLTEPTPAPVHAPATAPTKNALESPRIHGSATRAPAWLGPGLKIRGQVTGTEDLQAECKVNEPISRGGHGLTVGPNAHIRCEITAARVIVRGLRPGNLLPTGCVE